MNPLPVSQKVKEIKEERRKKADAILAKKCEQHYRNRDPNDTGIHPVAGAKIMDLPTEVATTLCKQVGPEEYRSEEFWNYFNRRYPELKPNVHKIKNQVFFSRQYSANYGDINWDS